MISPSRGIFQFRSLDIEKLYQDRVWPRYGSEKEGDYETHLHLEDLLLVASRYRLLDINAEMPLGKGEQPALV